MSFQHFSSDKIVVAAWLLLSLLTPTTATAAEPIVHYEYAIFSQVRLPEKVLWGWQTSSESIDGDSWEDIYHKMGGPESNKGGLVAILNLVGSRGWELVTTSDTEDAVSRTHAYIFKRRK